MRTTRHNILFIYVLSRQFIHLIVSRCVCVCVCVCVSVPRASTYNRTAIILCFLRHCLLPRAICLFAIVCLFVLFSQVKTFIWFCRHFALFHSQPRCLYSHLARRRTAFRASTHSSRSPSRRKLSAPSSWLARRVWGQRESYYKKRINIRENINILASDSMPSIRTYCLNKIST